MSSLRETYEEVQALIHSVLTFDIKLSLAKLTLRPTRFIRQERAALPFQQEGRRRGGKQKSSCTFHIPKHDRRAPNQSSP
jgi:hypothetical protein